MLWSVLKILFFVVIVAALALGAGFVMENGPSVLLRVFGEMAVHWIGDHHGAGAVGVGQIEDHREIRRHGRHREYVPGTLGSGWSNVTIEMVMVTVITRVLQLPPLMHVPPQ